MINCVFSLLLLIRKQAVGGMLTLLTWLSGVCLLAGGGVDSVSPGSLIEAQKNTEEYSFDLIVSLSREIWYKEREFSIDILFSWLRRQRKQILTETYFNIHLFSLCFCSVARGDRYREMASKLKFYKILIIFKYHEAKKMFHKIMILM